MVFKCFVTNCHGNCNAENNVKTFRLPRNPEERKSWITTVAWDKRDCL